MSACPLAAKLGFETGVEVLAVRVVCVCVCVCTRTYVCVHIQSLPLVDRCNTQEGKPVKGYNEHKMLVVKYK